MFPIFMVSTLTMPEKEKADYLYWKYRQILFSCAVKIVKDPHLAEDIVQTSFIAIFDHLDAIGDCDSKRTANYLITAVRHFAIDEYKRQKKNGGQTVELDDALENVIGDTDVWDTVKARASQEELFEVFQGLDDGHRFLLIAKYYYGWSYRELAQTVKISENAVSTRIVSAKRKLATLLSVREVL